MTRRPSPFVLFAAAAGPEIGFGHLIRCGVLADALGVPRQMVLRGTNDTRLIALGRGWTLHRRARLLDVLRPDLVVVDEPRADVRDRWVSEARSAGVAVATILDGATDRVDGDLVIDGSFAARPSGGAHHLAGPRYALLDPRIGSLRRRRATRDHRRVVVALGGGAHVVRMGVAIAHELTCALPDVHVDLAPGFTARAGSVDLPARCRWVDAQDGLATHLATAAAAVVAGGITMYEACALATPTVAVPVVDAQRRAIAAAAAAGAVVAPRTTTGAALRVPTGRATGLIHPGAIAVSVRHLLDNPSDSTRRARLSARLCDGRGLSRVTARLRTLCDGHMFRGVSHAA